MKILKITRQCWHDIYYYFSPKKGVKFAMTCHDFSQQVDVGVSKTKLGRFRFFLHLSLCQGCADYLKLTKILAAAIRKVVFKSEKQEQLERLNKKLLEIHSIHSHQKN